MVPIFIIILGERERGGYKMNLMVNHKEVIKRIEHFFFVSICSFTTWKQHRNINIHGDKSKEDIIMK